MKNIFITLVLITVFSSITYSNTNPATQVDVSGLCLFTLDTYTFAMNLGIEQEWMISDTFSIHTRLEYLNNSYFSHKNEYMTYIPVLVGIDIIDADWTKTVDLWGFLSLFAGYSYVDIWIKDNREEYSTYHYYGGAPEVDLRFQVTGIENKPIKFFFIAGYKLIYVPDATVFEWGSEDGLPALNHILNGLYLGINCTYFSGILETKE